MMVPIVDLSAADNLGQVARGIKTACETTGFFYVVNHGVSEVLQRGALAQTARLFGLPLAAKQQHDISRSKYMRGYFGHGADKSDGVHDDIKEGFDLALDLPETDPYVRARLPFYGPNTWPSGLPAFKPVIEGYYDAMIRLGTTLLRAFAIGLGVAEGFFDSRFARPMAQMRLLRYPPHHGLAERRIGAGEHTDFGYLTMILQDEAGGLEIRDTGGAWVPVPPLPGSLVVNIGDLMQRWTNNRYIATMHRVVNNRDRARYAIAFFMDPDYHARIECLPSCAGPTRPARYPPITAGEYMLRRFGETTSFCARAL
jgi:isopenicillin N synthase-like dioxygenase